MLKKIGCLLFLMFVLSGCFAKYIPARYFQEKHTMAVGVRPLPEPSHNLDETYEQDPYKKLETAVKSAARTMELRTIFSQIKTDEVRTDLQKSIENKVSKIFPLDADGKDLAVEVHITKWGWIVPPDTAFSFLSSYQLEIRGSVQVHDLKPSKTLIAHKSFVARENVTDRLSVSDTQRAIKKVLDDFSELVSEFLWRSDENK